MADEEKLPEAPEADEEVAEGTGKGKKKKRKGGPIPIMGILKWVAIVVAAIVLIVTVVIITMKIVNDNTSAQAVIPISEQYTTKREQLSWYTSVGQIRTKTSDALPANVMVDCVLGYKKDDKTTSTELTSRQVELQDFLRRYFSGKTMEDLATRNEERLRIEIRNSINDDILTISKIRDVKFLTLDVIPQ
jgi:flagellar FliL protein